MRDINDIATIYSCELDKSKLLRKRQKLNTDCLVILIKGVLKKYNIGFDVK